MTVRSAELGSIGWVAAGTQTIFTVPSGETWVVKDLRMGSTHTAALTMWFFIVRGAGSYLAIVQALAIGPSAAGLTPWIALEPGDQLVVIPSVTPTAGAYVWASGAKLAGVA